MFAAALALLALTPQDKTDWDAEGRACAELLQEMIRIDTINPPQDASKKNANETELCRHVQALLKKDGIEAEILEPEPGRGSLIARLKGTGAKKPVLLMAHIDVVGVDRGKWTVDPVAAMEKDGVIYGRGAIDDKGMAAVITHVFRMLKRRGEKLSRDVILMLNADEESGGLMGAKWVVDRHFEKVDAEFVINEGGRIGLKDGKLTQVGVQCAEKIYNDVRLWMRGTSGHSSVPRPDNAIYNLSAVLEKFRSFQTPPRVTDVAKAYFHGIADQPAYAEHRELMRRLPDPEAAEELARRDPRFNAMLRTTFVPTVIKGGIRVNVLPPDVEVNINIRLLPGDKLEDLLSALAKHAELGGAPVVAAADFDAWKAKQEEALRAGRAHHAAAWVTDLVEEDAPATPLATPLLDAVRETAGEMAPDGPVVPSMSTGATDSRFFRAKGRYAYGLMPLPVTEEEEKGFHGHDERVRVSSVRFGVEFVFKVLQRRAK